MTTLLFFIQAIALMGALTILAFDNRHSSHCKTASALAYVLFVLFGSLFLAALAKSWPFVTALLTAIVAVNVVNLVLARGNVKDISANIKPLPPSKPHSRRHHNTKHRKQQNV